MEFEIIEFSLEDEDEEGDVQMIREMRAHRERITVDEEDFPDKPDRAVHIPDEESVA